MILRRNYNDGLSELPIAEAPLDPSAQEYEILLEFDLKREKEKNMILEQRLKNKEVFIQQMKHFQQELTSAYEQCKNDLIVAQEKITYLQNVQFREYTEQIADLKHMLILKTQQSKRNSITRQEKSPFISNTTRIARNKSQKGLTSKHTDRRESKTSSHYNTRRERSVTQKIEGEVSKQIKKSAHFIFRFLQMAEYYMNELRTEDRLTKKLKRSWTWIKDVVKECDYLRERINPLQAFHSSLSELFKTEKQMDLGIFLELIKTRLNQTN